MKRHFAAQRWLCAWACVGMMISWSPASGQEPERPVAPNTDPVPAILDVQLAPGGVLAGQVVDSSGVPLPKAPVSVWRDNVELARMTTGADGRFAVSGLNGGLHRVSIGDGSLGVQLCRCWAPGTAPPAAQGGVLMVASGGVARGDSPPTMPAAPVLWATTPWVMAGAVVLAVAVPVAVFNHRENKVSKS